MFTSWMTTVIGVVALIVGGYLVMTGKITWDQFLAFLAIFGIGVTAKDFNKTENSN